MQGTPLARLLVRCILAVLFNTLATPPLAANPVDLQLVAIHQGKTYPVVALPFPGSAVIQKPDGSTERIRDLRLRLKGSAGPSLQIGYAPAQYQITRQRTNHHRAKAGGEPTMYELQVSGSGAPGEYAWWNDIDLSKLWDFSDEACQKANLFIVWRDERDEWGNVWPTYHQKGSFSRRLPLRKLNLPGRPIIFMWNDGAFIPPSVYADELAGTDFERIQSDWIELETIDDRAKDPFGFTTAHYLGSWGKTEAFAKATSNDLRKLRKVRTTNPSPLMLAGMHGHAETCERLIALGLRPTSEMPDMGFDAGHLAIQSGHPEVIEIFVANGYDRASRTSTGLYNPVTLALDTETGRDDIVGLLGGTEDDLPSLKSTQRQALLHREASRGHPNGIRMLVEDGAKPNRITRDRSPINLAVASGNTAAVRALLELGADPNIEQKVGPLNLAATYGDFETVEALLEFGADPNPPGNSPPLALAVLVGDTRSVRALLDAGADPNPIASGFGLAEYATITNQPEMVADLFAAGAVCQMDPEQAERILSHAIGNDIVEMAMLALDQCVAADFALFGEYPLPWVAEYFGAEKTAQWLAETEQVSTVPDPEIQSPRGLDAPPSKTAGSLFQYSQNLHDRFGRIETKVKLIIDENGQTRFPIVEESIPARLRLQIYESVATWQFTPPTVDGEPVKIKASLPLVFDRPDEEENAWELRQLSTPPKPVRQGPPEYPEALKRNQINGMVQLEFVIVADGSVGTVRVARSSHPLLSRSAIEAVKRWRFEPGEKDGRPVATRVRQNIAFAVR